MIVTRSATQADFDALGVTELAAPVTALAIEDDGTLLAVGGLMDLPDGGKRAFCNLAVPAERFGLSLHKAGRRMIEAAWQSGAPYIITRADPTNEAAVRWLERFGFNSFQYGGERYWMIP
jgi:hypothetical protein